LNIVKVGSICGQLAKPGIVMGNLIAALGGYFLASKGHLLDFQLFLAVVSGTSLVVASGCVCNNCIDSDIDRKMVRTCHRIMALRAVKIQTALCYGAALGGFGLLWLMSYTNPLSVMLALLGLVIYVGFYSLWLKRCSLYGNLIGSLSGAMPPAIGYTAVTGTVDGPCLLLILTFCLWQMPHAYAIALFRQDDFKAAGLPMLPIQRAKRQIVGYVALFLLSALALGYSSEVGPIYFFSVTGVGIYWLVVALSHSRAANDRLWARRVFGISIGMIMIVSLTPSIDYGSQTLNALSERHSSKSGS
jgi:protoheme IX farnesyltransferase